MRSGGFAAALTAGFIAIATPAYAQEHVFNIPAGSLKAALAAYGHQSGRPLIYRTDQVRGGRSNGFRGVATDPIALDAILKDTGLIAREDRSGAVAILRSKSPAAEKRIASAVRTDKGFEIEALALLVGDIVVTAQKREQRLQDVPVPVTAVNAQDLAERNQAQLQDFAATIPGLSVTPVGNAGTTSISIRGINSGAYTPATVAVTVDDVPSYGGLASVFSPVRPDLDPSDLARIEVLRGPQGTLYGASAMGGLINYVTVDPSVRGVSGRVEAGVSGISHGGDAGYNVRGSVNVPVSETFAVRASGFTRRDPGYIDNPEFGKKDINSATVSGGRISALWRPADNFSIKLAALYQHTKGDGQSQVDVQTPGYAVTNGLVGFQQRSVPGTGPYDQKYQLYSAVAKADFGKLNLVSITAYSHTDWNSSRDLSYAYGPIALPVYGTSAVGLFNSGKVSKFSEELRASLPIGKTFDWLVGAFYTHENFPTRQDMTALDPSGKALGPVGFTVTPQTYIEYAAFTDLTVHITDRFNIQLGGRESRIQLQQHGPALLGGLLFGGLSSSQNPNTTTDVFTYLVTPQYTVSRDLMVYARLASGFRSGQGFNSASLVNPALPKNQQPDKTQNYEIGIKGSLFDRKLTFDASLYYVDWKDIQLTLVDTNALSYGTNGARAKSQGVEVSLDARPWQGFTASGWLSYSNAVLTRSLGTDSTAYGPSGARLPYSARYSGHAALRQEFPISAGLSGFVQGSVTYVGRRYGNFLGDASPRQIYPSYVTFDANAGVKTGPWAVNVFVNNLTDKAAIIGGGLGTSPKYGRYFLQPRTFGLSLSRDF